MIKTKHDTKESQSNLQSMFNSSYFPITILTWYHMSMSLITGSMCQTRFPFGKKSWSGLLTYHNVSNTGVLLQLLVAQIYHKAYNQLGFPAGLDIATILASKCQIPQLPN